MFEAEMMEELFDLFKIKLWIRCEPGWRNV